MKIMTTLFADKGKILTDGQEFFGTTLSLAEGRSKTEFYEIAEETYQAILKETEENYDLED